MIDFEIACTVTLLYDGDCSKTCLVSKVLFQRREMMKTSRHLVEHS